jgi:uncharacterized Zn finger protein
MPACSQCGATMERKVERIRVPEVFLKCPTCGTVVDMSIEEYAGKKPEPSWALRP